MRVKKTAGLVGAGGVSRSFLARMPALLAHLGPVKGASLQVSRRIANSLRAGFGVPAFPAFKDCSLIWIAVPENTLDSVARELASEIRLHGKMVVLCDTLRDSLMPSPLRDAGAQVASLNCVPASEERMFTAEGHPTPVAAIRRLLTTDARKVIVLRHAAKSLYLSGLYLGMDALFPRIAGAVESLRAAGFSRAEAVRAIQEWGGRAFRAYGKAGDKAWNRAAAEHLHRAIERDLAAIRSVDPRLAMLLSDSSASMHRYFRDYSAHSARK
jgi:hypothetical protein